MMQYQDSVHVTYMTSQIYGCIVIDAIFSRIYFALFLTNIRGQFLN